MQSVKDVFFWQVFVRHPCVLQAGNLPRFYWNNSLWLLKMILKWPEAFFLKLLATNTIFQSLSAIIILPLHLIYLGCKLYVRFHMGLCISTSRSFKKKKKWNKIFRDGRFEEGWAGMKTSIYGQISNYSCPPSVSLHRLRGWFKRKFIKITCTYDCWSVVLVFLGFFPLILGTLPTTSTYRVFMTCVCRRLCPKCVIVFLTWYNIIHFNNAFYSICSVLSKIKSDDKVIANQINL